MRTLNSAVLMVAVLLSAPAAAATLTLISTNADWTLHLGSTEASSPDRTAWRTQTFDDAGWPLLPATFYYGESGIAGTLLTNMQGTHATIFLRKEFHLADPTALTNFFLNAVCDDGFVAWINDAPAVRYSPPTEALDDITITSVASLNAAEPVRFLAHPLATPTSYLQPGLNVLAVQVFNISVGSSDLVFDAELTAETVPGTPLGVATVSPVPGLLTSGLTRITVAFSEPVTGVVAAAMLVNGIGATSVSGAGATYTFEFPEPPFGTVSINWDVVQHPIAAAADPTRTLSLSTPGVVWAYELVSPEAPRLIDTQPQAGATVRVLTQVEVWFDKPVIGVDAADLLVNGQAATNVVGIGAGPYCFQFAAPAGGGVTFAWATVHSITDDTPLLLSFHGGTWSCAVDPQRSWGDVILNEVLAENVSVAPVDQDGDYVGWIELFNRGAQSVDLGGWSLTDDPEEPGKWVFPSYLLPAGGYLTVFASGKDQRVPGPGRLLHTNFKLSAGGEYLGLYTPDSPRQVVHDLSPQFPEQRPNYSFGRTPTGEWRYFATPTLDRANGYSPISNAVAEVHFSVERGFYAAPFRLSLACGTPGATIRYTTNSSAPAGTNGLVYTEPILINTSRVIRAAAFRTNALPSLIRTHTYLYNLPVNRRRLPVLSLVTASNHLYGTTGIMEYNPRNTTKHGIAWERPVSAELIRPEDNGGFQVDCGLRVAGGDYIRGLYNYRSSSVPQSKYSFRLYFRGDYGPGRLHYPWFPGTTVDSFDTVHLRAGMNDHTNPFILDEFSRQLESEVGQVVSHGTFVNLFLNGVYKGYYNPAEYYSRDFLQTYHGGSQDWDVIANFGEVNDGDVTAWNALRSFVNVTDLTNAANYLNLGRRMDLTNFVDYVLPLIYGDTDDWPHNNWRAARERVPAGVFRFYAWDAEFSYGFMGTSVSRNTIANQLSSTSPPWGSTQIQTLFNKLKRLPEFKLLFADRVHKHLFNGGALTDERIRQSYEGIRARVTNTISGFNNSIGTSWIPNRRRYLLQHLAGAGFLASSNAPVFSPFGGRVEAGAFLTMSRTNGTIYYTTNGADPRVMFTRAVAPDAQIYAAPLPLPASVLIKARTLYGTNWSALTEATFTVAALGLPLRITELMYNPPGGDAYEFIEIENVGLVPVPLQDFRFAGIEFRFPVGSLVLAPGARLVVASGQDPTAFAARYPGLTVAGHFDGSLSNGGERITLLDPAGRTVCAVDYDDDPPWPSNADGGGASLEVVDPLGDPDDPANWHAGSLNGGSPGQANPVPTSPTVRLTEVMAYNVSAVTNGGTCPDWIELHNPATASVSLQDWSLSDGSNTRSFVFPAGTTIAAGEHRVVWCDADTSAPGLHTGFALDADGETVALYDSATTRVDVITFGPQVANLTVGITGPSGPWQLCEPTPGAPNEPAQLAAQAGLVLNEFLANPTASENDWLELHNRDLSHAAPLRGLYFSTSNALCQLAALGFVGPGGYVQLRADELPGPNHLELKLPAGGATLVLSDATGAELDRVSYGSQAEGISVGRLPNGTGGLTGFPGTASPGAANYLVVWMGPVLNEVMARNGGAVTNAAGRVCDWLELFNPRATEYDLSGFSLSVGRIEPGEWLFPGGTRIAANGHLIVWCDGEQPVSTNAGPVLNLGHSLAGEGEVIHLFNAAGQVVDSVAFGFQLADASIGRTAEGWRLLSGPTPGGNNAVTEALASPAGVRINEWLADGGDEDDWLELYNPAPLPVDLGGLFLTDDPSLSGQTNFLIGPLTFIPAGGFVKWVADGQPENGRDHVNFSLDELGESLRLNASASQVIDGVDFEAMPPVISTGRWPDGATNFVWFHASPTPGESNYLPHPTIVLNEILTHTDQPLEDAIEVHNRSGEAVDLGGWFLSNSAEALRRCRIPTNTVVPAGGYVVLYENRFNPQPSGPENFTLNPARGDAVYLSEADAADRLTGYRASARVGASANGVSFGRVETSVGVDWAASRARTFGVDTPATVEQFRSGTGRDNAPPWVGPVVISEVMYHPMSGPTNDPSEDAGDEYLELHNATADAVLLYDPAHATNTWRIAGGVDYAFPTGEVLTAGETVLVVGFDPQSDPDAEIAFRWRYGLSGAQRLFGAYEGQLSNRGEAIGLLQPDQPQTAPHPDAGYVPYVRMDYVRYGTRRPWPIEADGTGWSLQRRRPLAYGNEPLNWKADAPTPGRVVVDPADVDTDGDGMPDVWEDANSFSRGNAVDALLDADGEGLSNLEEYWAGTNPRQPDTDGDGISDAWERANGLDPQDALDGGQDPDRDGLTHLQESVAATQPYNPDTDGDTLPDGWEVGSLLDPLQPDEPQADPDGDGMTTVEEYLAGTAPLDAASNLRVTLSLTDTEFVLRFTAQPNRRYTLEYRDDLTALTWSLWTTYPSTPAMHENELRWSRVGQSGSRYYRVVLLPQP